MKNSAFIFILILTTVFLKISAQEKTFTQKDLETIKLNADKKLKEVRYRLVKSKKFRKTEEESIFDFIPPDREHFVIKFKAPASKLDLPEFGAITKEVLDAFKLPAVNSYDEWIYIGEKIYYRDGVDKDWEQKNPLTTASALERKQACNCLEMPPIRTEYKFMPNQFINKQEADLYEVSIFYQYSFKPSPTIYKEKYWIYKNALPAKIQFSNDLNSDETILNYEYGLNLKIEAPFIKN